jgi:DNA-binding MarR family transcriptional regulator
MSTTKALSDALKQWAEVFIHRSMHDLIRFIKETDLSMGQYATLVWLYHHQNCGVTDVGSHLSVTSAAASQLVDKLVHLGLVERAEAAHDRRMKHLTLTPKGRALVERSLEARLSWTEAMVAGLPPERHEPLRRALLELVAAAERLPEMHGDGGLAHER